MIVGLLWNLHRDVAKLHQYMANIRERLARHEGAVDILTKFLSDRELERESS